MKIYKWSKRSKHPVGLSAALNVVDKSTNTLTQTELHKLHARGDLPSGVYHWLIALRKADIAIPCKNPRPL